LMSFLLAFLQLFNFVSSRKVAYFFRFLVDYFLFSTDIGIQNGLSQRQPVLIRYS